ncbi:MAG: LuxR C-terminal-related transcriptional regulator [Treponema sp.]|nr:LuxR C-terminal-related transcriptional regulator [Treponema sp.]
MSEQLFRSNIPITPGSQVYLKRPRIDLLLEKAWQNPVIIVAGGAGFGKTYAVYSFVKQCNTKTAWIQLSERDNIDEHFWENFVAAISVMSGDIAQKLAAINFPDTEQQFERYLGIPRGSIVPGEKYIVVYDDMHLLNDKPVLRFLERTITSPFPNIVSIIISRTEPALNLMKMESKGLLARITEEDLRFTREEMVSYFRLLDVKLPPQAAAAVYQDTEGWAFAIHLAGLFLKNAFPNRGTMPDAGYMPSVIRPNIFKLIESEVMAPLPEALQRFLIKLSLVERLAPELLIEIAGNSALIKDMARLGSYIRFDTYLNAYRIHHLFLDYLKGRQNCLSAKEKIDVWEKTAAWSMANNQKMDAISCYEKAGNYAGIVSVLYSLPLILPDRLAQYVLDLMDRSPQSIYRDYPLNIIIRNRILISLGRYEQAKKELMQIIPLVRQMPESPGKHRILMGCNMHLGFIGFIDVMRTRNYDFLESFREAARESRLMGNYVPRPPVNGVSMGSHACRVMLPQPEEIEKIIDLIKEAVPCASEAMGGCMSGMYELARGEFAFFRGEADRAEKFLLEGLRRGRENAQYEIENRALFYLLRIYLGQARISEIRYILGQLEAELDLPFFMTRYLYYDIVTGWYYIQTGQTGRVASWLKNDYEENELNFGARVLERLVRAKFYLYEKRYPAVLATLENFGGGESLLMGNIETKALEAVCRYQSRDREGAFRVLAEACELAAPAGLFFPFVELGKDMRTLTSAALKQENLPLPRDWLERINREASSYAKKLFFVAEQPRDGAERKFAGEGAALSRREMEILRSLCQGLTRKEMARVSSISINTVKSTIRSIYNKLGAVNRADAVRIATEMNLSAERQIPGQ